MKVINFGKSRYIMVAFSVLLIIAGLVVAFTKGPNWGIDFKDGLAMTISVKDFNAETATFDVATAADGKMLIEEVRSWFLSLDKEPRVQLQSTENAQFSLRSVFAESAENTTFEDRNQMVDAEKLLLVNAMDASGVTVVESAAFEAEGFSAEGRVVVIEATQTSSPSWTANSWNQLIVLMLVVFLLITIYIWFRFKWSYAISSMLALFHDILIMIGFISIMPYEVSKTTIAAMLTIIGYSLNDTIVIFDRIRENQKSMISSSLSSVVDTSVTQSLSRTLLTSLTTLLSVIALFIFTQGDVKSFAANMMVGIVFGTLSSNFIAASSFIWLTAFADKIVAKRKFKKYGIAAHKSSSDPASANVDTVAGNIEIPVIERKLRRKKK